MFQELMRASGQEKVLEMVQLTIKLPPEAKRLITGITDPKEAREKLDKMYGDTDMIVLAGIYKLMSRKPRQRPAYKNLEDLVTGGPNGSCF